MRPFLFLSRLAFICNLFFVLAVLLQWRSFIQDEAALSTVVILGYFLGVFLINPLANLACLIIFIAKRQRPTIIPGWLVWTNFLFLILQILFSIFTLWHT